MVARPSSKSSTTYDCETIVFNSYLFYPNKPIHALVTVDHRSAVDASYIHDAPVAWIDRLTNDSLTACVYVAGRGERHDTTDVSLDWLVYQGAPDGSMGGVVQLDSEWWTGTTCEKVTMERAFSSPPLVLATLRHSVIGLKHDAASLWVEDIRTDSFSLCVRELQNFDGAHENISIVSDCRNDHLGKVKFSFARRLGWLLEEKREYREVSSPIKASLLSLVKISNRLDDTTSPSARQLALAAEKSFH